jgi:hypothetical protein
MAFNMARILATMFYFPRCFISGIYSHITPLATVNNRFFGKYVFYPIMSPDFTL